MIRFARDFRLIPVVLLATICLFALKVSGLVFDGGYTLAERLQGRNKTDMQITTRRERARLSEDRRRRRASAPRPAAPASKQSWAQEMFNFGDGNGDITGSVGGEEQAERPAAQDERQAAGAAQARRSATSPVPIEPGQIASAGERAILERLQDRRKELDTRSRELEMRESLLKATEKRLDAKVAELKDVEARVNTADGHARQGRGGALQEHRHHVREHEVEGRRAHLRPSRHEDPGRGRDPDQAGARCRKSSRR